MRANSADTDSVSGIQKSKRPPNTAFRQQRLKAWQPILSPQSILPLLMLIICVFSPIGIALLLNVRNVQDLIVNYSHCDTDATDTFQNIPHKYIDYHFKRNVESQPQWRTYTDDNSNKFCEIKFSIPSNISKPVYAYYKLTNFYQNHRKYVQSFDLYQLKGNAVDKNDLSENCKPLDAEGDKVIYPCGLIANSLFNDTFSDVLQGLETTANYTMSRKGISWKTDRSLYKKTKYSSSQIVPPPNWKHAYPNGYTDDNIPNLAEWEDFQVWMRTAGLPRFYKLALKNEDSNLPAGQYMMKIGMNYPVTIFGGTKSFVLTSNSVIGARNISLGIAYLAVAIICCVFELIFIVKVIIQPRKLGDHTYLNFDQQQESSSNPPIASQLREML